MGSGLYQLKDKAAFISGITCGKAGPVTYFKVQKKYCATGL